MTTTGSTLGTRREQGGTPVLADWGADSEYGMLRDVLLGPPQFFEWMPEANSQYSSVVRETARQGERFDKQVAMRQHRELVDAYEAAGVKVHMLSGSEFNPYGVYARDSSFMTPWGAVISQMANPRRRGEYAQCLRFYLEHGIPIYDLVTAGNFEGGDFNMIAPGSVLVAYTGLRCEEVAAREVGGWLEREGWEVRYTAIDGFYVHIDLMVCMVAEKAAAVCLDTTEPAVVQWLKDKGIEIVPVGFRETMALGCNVMALGGDRVIAPAHAVELNAKLRALGFTVYDPEMSMFTRAGGGVHCLSQPLRRDAA